MVFLGRLPYIINLACEAQEDGTRSLQIKVDSANFLVNSGFNSKKICFDLGIQIEDEGNRSSVGYIGGIEHIGEGLVHVVFCKESKRLKYILDFETNEATLILESSCQLGVPNFNEESFAYSENGQIYGYDLQPLYTSLVDLKRQKRYERSLRLGLKHPEIS